MARRERSSKGTVVHKEPILYKGSKKSSIVVIDYDGLLYATEFISDAGNKSEKIRLAKTHSSKIAIEACKDRAGQQLKGGWMNADPIFGAIQEKSDEESVSKFLDKYG